MREVVDRMSMYKTMMWIDDLEQLNYRVEFHPKNIPIRN